MGTRAVKQLQVFFDLDGTIVNTMPVLEDLALETIAHWYAPAWPAEIVRERYRATSGRPFQQQLELLFPDSPVNFDAAADYDASKRDRLGNTEAFADVWRVLRRLRDMGAWLACCSSTERSLVVHTLRRTQVIGALDVVLGWPPTKAEQVSAYAGANAVLVGDSLQDGEYARQAGVRFLGVQHLFSYEQFAVEHLLSVPSLGDVPWAIDQLTRS